MMEIRSYLEELGQQHLGLDLETLSPVAQNAFLKQLQAYGHETLHRQRALLKSGAQPAALSSYKALENVKHSGSSDDRKLGEQLIQDGKVGCLILAGGQGTRLGLNGPKGMLSITPVKGKSLFQILCERIVCAGSRAKRALPLAIMTAPANHEQTRQFFDSHALFGLCPEQLSFFTQDTLPLLDEKGNWLLQDKGMLAVGPDGNGNALKRFFESGLGENWAQAGVEYINVIFVDNPLADPFDSEFIGFTARCALDCGMKVVERLSLDEKMGIVVEEQKRLKVIEYSEFNTEESKTYRYASPGLFCFSMAFMRQTYADNTVAMPLHLARKTASVIPANGRSPKNLSIYKCETFQFDLLDYTHKNAAILYPRERTYAPVKNAQGDKSPARTREALLHFDKEIYTELSGLSAPAFAFELDPAFYYPDEALRQQMQGHILPDAGYIRPQIVM